MKLIIGLCLLFICGSCQSNEADDQSAYATLTTSIDSVLHSQTGFNGVVLLRQDTSVVYAKVAGFSDFERQSRLQMNSQFVIGSISKQITAVLVLREYEKGRLNLKDKVGDFLDNIDQPWAKDISIHHLLSHTHGIVSLDEPLTFEQGTQFNYSQLGYELLAQILELVTGKSFRELSEALFASHDLSNSFHPQSKGYTGLVNGYIEEENDSVTFASNSMYNYAAAGSFISDAEDLATWSYLLHSNKLLKQETVVLMKKRYATREHPIFNNVEYGYGLLFKDGEQGVQIGALGYAPGFVSASYYYPKNKMSLVVLENVARNLNDFSETFRCHLALMEAVKVASLTDN